MASSKSLTSLPALPRHRAAPHGQQGIALFVALIVMVALSLAGVALIRSINTTNSVTGNIAFRQAALVQANWAIEEAIGHVYAKDSKLSAGDLIDTLNTNAGKCYKAIFVPSDDSNTVSEPAIPAGLPRDLWKRSSVTSLDVSCRPPDNTTGNRVAYIIQRMCDNTMEGAEANQAKCELMTPKQALGTTVGDDAIKVGKYPLYRVTVRVDGPNNALAFVQAMIRG